MLQDKLLQARTGPPTEFEIHADCYQILKEHYPCVRGEVKLQFKRPDDKKIRRPRGARFDLVVYSDTEPLFIVEVKRFEGRTSPKKLHYETLSGVSCYTVGSVAELHQLVRIL